MEVRKSANDHLNNGKQPKIVHMIPPGAPGFREAAGGSMVVSTPAELLFSFSHIGEVGVPWLVIQPGYWLAADFRFIFRPVRERRTLGIGCGECDRQTQAGLG